MKFLRQKETKRKISFLMALAMMVSLLPVSPVAQAAVTPTVKKDDSITLNIQMVASPVTGTGSSVITIKPEEGKIFNTAKKVSATVEINIDSATSSAVGTSTPGAISTAGPGTASRSAVSSGRATTTKNGISVTVEENEASFMVTDLDQDAKSILINVKALENLECYNKDGGASTATGGGIYFPGSGNTAPGTSTSPAPSASASAAPSATPAGSAAPGTSSAPTNAPGTSSAPTNAPGTSSVPTATPTNAPTTTTTVKVGNKVTASNLTYKVTSVSGTRTVQFTGAKSGVKIVKIPATIKINGKSYKVTTIVKGALRNNTKVTKVIIGKNINKIGKNAFRGCKNLKTVRINVTNLTASKVKANAFKGIKKNATFKVPKGKIKKYRKIVQAKGAGKKIKVIKK